MTMGARIRAARLEAGLSQRELAGEEFTRNMLSVLENDGANPSVATLAYLSKKLCKPVSYFLGEEPPGVAEAAEMESCRLAFRTGEFRRCLEGLEGLEAEHFRAERQLLTAQAHLALAEEAVNRRRFPLANRHLAQALAAGEDCPYFGPELRRKHTILSALSERKAAKRAAILAKLPEEEELLLLRAQSALTDGQRKRAGHLLDSTEKRGPEWYWLRGEVWFGEKEYARAAECYHKAEASRPGDTRRRLEICYRELEDYKMAYYYATKQ